MNANHSHPPHWLNVALWFALPVAFWAFVALMLTR